MMIPTSYLRVALVALLLLLAGAPLAAQAAPAAPPRSAADGVFTEAQAQRGETTFRQVCAACHTSGDFRGEPFLKRWPTVGSLFDVVSTTMPQDNPASLTAQQYAELIAYVLKNSGFRAGTSELPPETQALNAISVPARPPG
jgi:mono/diheme cytochrome c family protein